MVACIAVRVPGKSENPAGFQRVKILGGADIHLQCIDGPVSLPRVHVKASVVGSLAAVGTYKHLGAGVNAGIGGVSIG